MLNADDVIVKYQYSLSSLTINGNECCVQGAGSGELGIAVSGKISPMVATQIIDEATSNCLVSQVGGRWGSVIYFFKFGNNLGDFLPEEMRSKALNDHLVWQELADVHYVQTQSRNPITGRFIGGSRGVA